MRRVRQQFRRGLAGSGVAVVAKFSHVSRGLGSGELTGALFLYSMATFAGGLGRARQLLAERFGHAAFRVHQLKVLGPLLTGRSVLAVLPTGAGKSLCYQLPALLARGLTLVISPLISLMQDQVAALRRRGIPAAYLNSLLSPTERRAILDAALSGSLTLLYCAPERLGSLVRQLSHAGREVSLLAVDEAHCIVEWGNEFRPVYRRLDRYRYLLGDPVTIALTGSATPGTRAEILRVLRIPQAEVVVTSFDRPNLVFCVERVRDDRERFARMRELIRGVDGPVIVYTPTRRLTELVARALLRRSEEHTSELQSPCNLVCRLLLEKKNGGHHERDRRPGTENVPGAVALGCAAERMRKHQSTAWTRLAGLRDRLEKGILTRVPDPGV